MLPGTVLLVVPVIYYYYYFKLFVSDDRCICLR
jgi:hypothetical protein